MVVDEDVAFVSLSPRFRQTAVRIVVVHLVVEGCPGERSQDRVAAVTQCLQHPEGRGQVVIGKIVDDPVY